MAPSHHVTYLFLILSTNVFLLAWVSSETFQPSTNVNTEIALHSNISVTRNCTAPSCNQTCPYRDDFPPFEDVLANKGENCSDVVSGVPSAANKSAQTVEFNSQTEFNDTSGCLSVEFSVTQGDQDTSSISFWVQANCSNACQILRYGILTLNLTETGLELSTSQESTNLTNNLPTPPQWTHIILRHDGTKLQGFVDGEFVVEVALGTQTSNLTIGGDLMTGNSIALADVRFYGDVLTNREVEALYKGTVNLDTLPLESDCRCPPEAPKIQAGSTDMCTRQDGTAPLRRLNIDGGYLAYINDNDITSCWRSDEMSNHVTLAISLQNVFQIAGLTLHGLDASTETLVVQQLYAGEVTRKLTFQQDPCGTTPDCQSIESINGSVFNLDESSISVRQDLKAFLADTVNLILSSSSVRQFSVCEVDIHVRCHCMGNDESCVVNQTNYTCDCSHNTTGENCEDCSPEYYRQADEFSCSHSCDCNTMGSKNNICNQVGGQCDCKANVNATAGRICDQCNFNTIKLGSNNTYGCTECDCNDRGIQYCNLDGTCVCKTNTETVSGRCDSCLPGHYGLDMNDGCQPCDCHIPGTTGGQANQCNETTGDCHCKINVMGRQCDTCKDKWYNLRQDSPTGCEDKCECNFVGSIMTERCDIRSGNCTCMDGRQHNRQCEPEITNVSPTYGPKAGGTIITVTGVLLGNPSTSNMTFHIGGAEQEILSWNSTLITVKTGPVDVAIVLGQSLIWVKGSSTIRDDNSMFEYKDDPDLLSQQSFVTYTSGRCQLKVKGNNMNSTENPKIVVHTNSINITETCQPMSDGEMLCSAPDVSQYNITGSTSFGFMFDGFRDFEVLDTDTGVLMVTEDPVVSGFTDSFGNTFNTEIEITGERLNSACVGELHVFVGEAECTITSITDSTIVCEPRESFPGTSRNEKLVVVFGDLRLEPGIIKFKDFWNTQPFVYIVVGLGCLVLIVIVILVLICVRRRRGNTERESINMGLIEQPGGRETPTGVVNPIMSTVIHDTTNDNSSKIADAFLERLHDDVRKTLKLSLVEISNIKPGIVCTQKGELVRIINGTFSSNSGSPGDKLTIKTNIASYPESGVVPDWLEKGLLESTRMRDQIHDNVLASCGMSIDVRHVYILYPEMSNRTLKDHLTAAPEPFTEEKRLDISVHVAEGMNFLDGHHIVHKDLAARNCWVNSEGIVKIADASFTADLYPEEYLIKDGLTMPVRWMAPESLRQAGFYHSKSDVWSFGVLMWEVFTNGFVPYYDITNNADIADLVCNKHYQLGIPHGCSDKIFSVIQLCLNEYSEDRPNFFVITNHLTDIISPQSPVSYVNAEGLQDAIYQNTQMAPAAQPMTTRNPPLPPKSRRK